MSFNIIVRRRLGQFLVDQTIDAGPGLTVLFGPSGSGKSSILNMVAGLLKPDDGRIVVGSATLFDSRYDVDLPPERRRMGYVFQDARLFPHRRVGANLRFGYDLAPPQDRWLSIEDAVRFLGIDHLLERWPQTLSGGEAQRVAIGRALLAGPRALLMDEPLSSLDRARREEILSVIERVRDELQIPILYVTHDWAEAERLGSTIFKVG